MPEESTAKSEIGSNPVEIRFGDVVEPLFQGKQIEHQVVTETAEDHLQASKILREDDGTEYLSPDGTLVWPVKVMGHWDFDQVFAGVMHFWEKDNDPLPPDQRDRMKKILEVRFNKPPVMYTGRETD